MRNNSNCIIKALIDEAWFHVYKLGPSGNPDLAAQIEYLNETYDYGPLKALEAADVHALESVAQAFGVKSVIYDDWPEFHGTDQWAIGLLCNIFPALDCLDNEPDQAFWFGSPETE